MRTISIFLMISLISLSGSVRGKSDRQSIRVAGVKNAVLQLDGIWKFSMKPEQNFWRNGVSADDWHDIQVPDHPWELDRKDFYYHGIDRKLPLTNMARALKENIYSYSLLKANGPKLQIFANGDQACRLGKKDEGFILYIDNQWDYTSLLWGNYMKRIDLPGEYKDTVIMKIE